MNGTQDIYRLRREGRLQEALHLARQLNAADGNNPEHIKALFWCLYSIWKDCNELDKKQLIAREILDLKVPMDDQMLQNALHVVRRAQDPAAPVIAQSKNLSQAGHHKQAAAVLEQFLRQHRGNNATENALAWEIWWQLNGMLKEDKPPAEEIAKLVHRYAQLQTVERPSLIHSRMLEIVAKAARLGVFPKFCAFLHWWGPDKNIRTQDLTSPTNNEGREFPSVVQHVIFAIGKTIEDEPEEKYVKTALEFLHKYVPQYPREEWFPYFLGVGLCKVLQLDEALKYLVPFARTKSRDFWVWQKLANCFPTSDKRYLACLCRSVLCGSKKPEFLLNVRQQLASALHKAGYDGEARYEIEALIALRQQHGWKIPDELARLQKEDWFEAAKATEGMELFRSLSGLADDVLMHDIPWTDALLLAKDVQGEKGPLGIVLVDLPTGTESIRLRMNAFDVLGELQAGAPISVRVATDGIHKRILALKERAGQPWDLLPETCAIVTRVNREMGMTSLLLKNGEISLAHHDVLPEAAQVHAGDFLYTRSAPGRDVKHARTLRRCDKAEPSQYWKSFDGSFKPRAKGGGHVGDVFVPDLLAGEFTAGCQVHGVAIKQTGNRGDSWWVAVKIQSVHFGGANE